MDLVAGWLRSVLKAGAAAALVPIAIVSALLVAVAGAGGLGGIGALGQIVTGPAVSSAPSVAGSSGGSDAGERVRDVAIVAPPELVAAVRPAAPPRRPGTTAQPAPRRVVTPRDREPGRPPAPPPLPPLPPEPPTPPPPPAPTEPVPTKPLVDQVGDAVGAVGTVVEEVVEGLGETVEGLLGGPPGR